MNEYSAGSAGGQGGSLCVDVMAKSAVGCWLIADRRTVVLMAELMKTTSLQQAGRLLQG